MITEIETFYTPHFFSQVNNLENAFAVFYVQFYVIFELSVNSLKDTRSSSLYKQFIFVMCQIKLKQRMNVVDVTTCFFFFFHTWHPFSKKTVKEEANLLNLMPKSTSKTYYLCELCRFLFIKTVKILLNHNLFL